MAQQRRTVVRQRTQPDVAPVRPKKRLPAHMVVSPELARRFAAEYNRDQNATQAYMRAKPDCTHKGTAATQGGRLLRNPHVKALIDAGERRTLATIERTAVGVMQLMWEAATLDPLEFFDEHGRLRPLKDVPLAARRRIAALKVARANLDRTDGKKSSEWLHEVKFQSGDKLLELIGKHHKLYDRAGEDSTADVDKFVARINRARQRMADSRKKKA